MKSVECGDVEDDWFVVVLVEDGLEVSFDVLDSEDEIDWEVIGNRLTLMCVGS